MMTIDQPTISDSIQMWLDDLGLKSATSSLEDELIFDWYRNALHFTCFLYSQPPRSALSQSFSGNQIIYSVW